MLCFVVRFKYWLSYISSLWSEMTRQYLSVGHEKSCSNSPNAKERCFNGSFLISFSIEFIGPSFTKRKENGVQQFLALETLKTTHHSAVRLMIMTDNYFNAIILIGILVHISGKEMTMSNHSQCDDYFDTFCDSET